MALLKCQLNIIKLKNFDVDLSGKLFIRYYISDGSKRRIRIDTREIQSTCKPSWNEIALLECQGEANRITELVGKRNIVFELRWRSEKHILSRIMSSKLLARAEASWKDMFTASTDEKWIKFVSTNSALNGLKPLALLVKTEAQIWQITEKTVIHRKREGHECGCRDCKWNADEEYMFAATETALIDACLL